MDGMPGAYGERQREREREEEREGGERWGERRLFVLIWEVWWKRGQELGLVDEWEEVWSVDSVVQTTRILCHLVGHIAYLKRV